MGYPACSSEPSDPDEGGPDEGGPDEGACSDDSPCTMDSDCAGGMRCNEEECTRLFCVEDGEPCSTSEVCVSRSCVDTPTGAVCWSGQRSRGWACSEDFDCTEGLLCDSGECADPWSELTVTPRSLTFTMVEGEANPPSQTLEIENPGNDALQYGISSDVSWLFASQWLGVLSGGGSTEITLSVDGTGLTPGELTTVLTVDAMGALGSPVDVEIAFSIAPPPHCSGTPLTCAGRGTATCTMGCSPSTGPGCVGSAAIDCSPYSGGECGFCGSIVGCACDTASTCVEAPEEGAAACTSQTNQTTCIQFTGCRWGTSTVCMGTPEPCETLDNATCARTPGCSVVP
jgi:hypothetical protein